MDSNLIGPHLVLGGDFADGAGTGDSELVLPPDEPDAGGRVVVPEAETGRSELELEFEPEPEPEFDATRV